MIDNRSLLPFFIYILCYPYYNCEASDDYCNLNECPCKDSDPQETFGFLRHVAKHHEDCNRKRTVLYCCINGLFDEIYWDFSTTSQGNWMTIKQIKSQYIFVEQNQTFILNQPLKGTDDGYYRCNAIQGSKTISSVINYVIRDCDDPCYDFNKACPATILIPQVENSIKTVNLGDNIKLTCHVKFHTDSWQNYYGWKWLDEDGVIANWNNLNQNIFVYDKRYKASFSYDNSAAIFELEIHYIEESDLHRFECFGQSPQTNATSRTIILQLSEPSPYGTPVTALILTLAFLFVMVAILLIIIWRYNLEIRLWIKENKHRQEESPEGIFHDALIVCCERDASFVEDILLPGLEQHSYKICYEDRDFLFGEHTLHKYLELTKKSQSIILVLSPSLLQSKICEFIFEATIVNKYQNMVFIQYKNIDSNVWTKEQRVLEAAIAVSKKKVKWIESGMSRKTAVTSKDSDKFMKKLRLALPKPLSSFSPKLLKSYNSVSSSTYLV